MALSAVFFSALFSLCAQEKKIENLRDFLDSEIAAGKKEIIVPAGRYEVEDKGGAHLVFRGVEGVTIKAYDVDLVCKQTSCAILIVECKNFKIEGLRVDYDPLPFTQGKIVAMSDDKMVHEIEIFDGYPDTSRLSVNKYEIFDQNTRRLKVDTYSMEKIEPISKTRFKAYKAKHCMYRKFQNEEIGDIVVTASSSEKGRGGHAIYISYSKDVTLKDINLYASCSFGFFDYASEGLVYDTCRVLRRETGDIAKRANPRVRSLNADGFHSKISKKGPTYLNCETGWNGDDSIAINGTYHLVIGSKGNKLRVISNRNPLNIDEGDRVEIFKTDGSVEYATVKSVLPAAKITEEEEKWLYSLPIYPGFKEHKTFKSGFEVELDREIDVPRRSMILNANMIGNGFKIKGGKFGNNRSRGLIIKCGHGVIEGATIEAAWMESIKIAPEWFWFEGGHTENLVIKNNVIKCGAGPAITINSPKVNLKEGFGPAGAHRNIAILNNKISYVSLPVIFATSVQDLRLSKNKLNVMDDGYYMHDYGGRHMGTDCTEPITLINCSQK